MLVNFYLISPLILWLWWQKVCASMWKCILLLFIHLYVMHQPELFWKSSYPILDIILVKSVQYLVFTPQMNLLENLVPWMKSLGGRPLILENSFCTVDLWFSGKCCQMSISVTLCFCFLVWGLWHPGSWYIVQYCDYANELLVKFVTDAEILYDRQIMVYNVHCLINLAVNV